MSEGVGTSGATTREAAVFVARQPIFTGQKEVFGYELLFRSGLENYCHCLDPDQSTLDVIANSFFAIGFEELTDGKRAFINFTRALLLKGVAALLPADRIVIEITEGTQGDEDVLAACRKLRESGYTLAMDDFVPAHRDSPLLELTDIVKVDFLGTTTEEQRQICRELIGRGLPVLAEKVETVEQFDLALQMGCIYFQGYFFSKPVIRSGSQISGNKLAYLRLLEKINRPGISYEEIEELIKQDVALTYKLLRFINSAWFGLRRQIDSIKHALVLLGPKEIRKWFALVALRHMASDKPQELLVRTIARAKAGERLGPLIGMGEQSAELFLMGIFSTLDALMDMPMPDVLEKLPLSEEIKTALLGGQCAYRAVYDTILSYEAGDWEVFSQRAAELRLDEASVPQVFEESLKWAAHAFAAV
jgi:EAL and modified HD-GYP domain-containing signal transduction protein